MRVVFRMSAIVAALAILGGAALGGCGQRGPLYLPTVPPLPQKPTDQTEPPPSDVRPDAETASLPASSTAGAMAGSMPDTSGMPLSLSPDSELGSPPNASTSPPAPRRASGTSPDQ